MFFQKELTSNPNINEFEYLYRISKDILSGLLAIISISIAFEALTTWKLEKIVKDDRNAAIELLLKFSAFFRSISESRINISNSFIDGYHSFINNEIDLATFNTCINENRSDIDVKHISEVIILLQEALDKFTFSVSEHFRDINFSFDVMKGISIFFEALNYIGSSDNFEIDKLKENMSVLSASICIEEFGHDKYQILFNDCINNLREILSPMIHLLE